MHKIAELVKTLLLVNSSPSETGECQPLLRGRRKELIISIFMQDDLEIIIHQVHVIAILEESLEYPLKGLLGAVEV